jgi:hypothetical protein
MGHIAALDLWLVGIYLLLVLGRWALALCCLFSLNFALGSLLIGSIAWSLALFTTALVSGTLLLVEIRTTDRSR